jgi:hypothetical protein
VPAVGSGSYIPIRKGAGKMFFKVGEFYVLQNPVFNLTHVFKVIKIGPDPNVGPMAICDLLATTDPKRESLVSFDIDIGAEDYNPQYITFFKKISKDDLPLYIHLPYIKPAFKEALTCSS